MSVDPMKFVRHLPILGTGVAFALYTAATARYPGGTDWSPDTVGHRWAENFVCAVLKTEALIGTENAARPLGLSALVVLCTSVGAVFFMISRSTSSRALRSTIEIAGIGTAVYSVLVPTPIHDLMVTLGLAFGAVAFGAVLRLLSRERRPGLLAGGIVLIAIQVFIAVGYYGHVR